MCAIRLDDPVFIIGNPRSGTSLLRLLLTCHSQILIPPECGFIIWLKEKFSGWTKSDNGSASKIKLFVDELFACKKFDTWLMDKGLIEEQILIHQPAAYAELCALVYCAFGTSTGKSFKVWGDKNNFHLNHLNELSELYSNARFLHIVRDGRDIACSYREVMAAKSNSPYAPRLATGIEEIALEWSNNVLKIDAFMSQMQGEAAMTIRYEDLVKTPASIMTSICEWLGMAFEAEMLEFYSVNRTKKIEPELTLDWKKQTLQPINDKFVSRYTCLLSAAEIHEFQKIASAAFKRFCYE